MSNPNPNTSGLRPFKPGQSGNPGGKPREQIEAEREAARLSSILRAKMTAKIAKEVDEGADILDYLKPEALKLFKDSEDRAHGTPRQSVDHTTGGEQIQAVSGFDVRVVNASASDADKAAG